MPEFYMILLYFKYVEKCILYLYFKYIYKEYFVFKYISSAFCAALGIKKFVREKESYRVY